MRPESESRISKLPPLSLSVWSDIRQFLLHKPEKSTELNIDDEVIKEEYASLILQRLDTGISEYSILNIHKIGIEVPVRYVFEEIIKWDGDSTYWPNHLANVTRINGQLDEVDIYLFGRDKIGINLREKFIGLNVLPLFMLKSKKIKITPSSSDLDNARYLLFECSGGYPIGIFAMYTRSSIQDRGEREKTQLFFLVAFNFYGSKKWFFTHFLNRIWRLIHNRATSNILNRIKSSYEWKFNRITNPT